MQLDSYRLKQDILRREAATLAGARYDRNGTDIDKIRDGLLLVREGLLPLVSLDDDPKRLSSRLLREDAPDIGQALERINGAPNFQDAWIVDSIAHLKSAVCRLSLNVSLF